MSTIPPSLLPQLSSMPAATQPPLTSTPVSLLSGVICMDSQPPSPPFPGSSLWGPPTYPPQPSPPSLPAPPLPPSAGESVHIRAREPLVSLDSFWFCLQLLRNRCCSLSHVSSVFVQLAGNVALVNGGAAVTGNDTTGNWNTSGFVMLKLRGTWGPVCSVANDWGQWSSANARVVCRQLGLPWSGATSFTGSLGAVNGTSNDGVNFGTSPVAAAVSCAGTESQLEDCPMFWGVPNSYTNVNMVCTSYAAAGMGIARCTLL